MTRSSRTIPFAGAFAAALLAIFMQVEDQFTEEVPTAVAMLALLAALPMVDSALFGRSVHPALGGAALGWSLGFFVRQASLSSALAAGAERVIALAFVMSLVLALVRWHRSRRQRT